MRESGFIEQNKKKWAEYEKILELKEKDPDDLSELYVQVTDDLSYSRTFYPNRSVRVYLNNLAQKIHSSIYRNRKENRNKFIYFWKEELPLVIFESRKAFFLSLALFLLASFIGVFSTVYDLEFPTAILGEDYIEMTEKNIAKGDPMAVYKNENEISMFLGITLNNLMVAFITFLSGVFFGIGTIVSLIRNGVMVGTFQYYFATKDLLLDSALTIWMHGTLEISAIIIAGAAGFELSRGLVFPGTLRRIQAFQSSARRGMKIMLGVFPIFIVAGFIEGFITRHTETPNWLRALAIFLSLTFIISYFVVYPWLKSRQERPEITPETERLSPEEDRKIDFSRIKSVGDLFSDTFLFYRNFAGRFVGMSAFISVCLTLIWGIFYGTGMNDTFFIESWDFGDFMAFNWGPVFRNFFQFLNFSQEPLLGIFSFILFALTGCYSITLLQAMARGNTNPQHQEILTGFIQNLGKSILVSALLNGVLFIPWDGTWLFFISILPFCTLGLSVMVMERKGLDRMLKLLTGQWADFLILNFMLMVIGVIVLFFINSPFLGFYFYFVQMNFILPPEQMGVLMLVLFGGITWFALGLVLPILFTGFGIQYFTLKEILDADALFGRISTLGKKSTLYGMEKET